jgi:hypothetical protein
MNKISIILVMLFALALSCSKGEIEYQAKSQREKCKAGKNIEGKKDVARESCNIVTPILLDNSVITNRTEQSFRTVNYLILRCLVSVHKLNQCDKESSYFP